MGVYEDKLRHFFEESERFGRNVHDDTVRAAKIFKAIAKKADFDALIAQNEHRSNDFLNECHAFATVLLEWSRSYPVLINDFRSVLRIVVEDLNRVEGLSVSISGDHASIDFNEKKFVFHFEENLPHETGEFTVLSEQEKEELARKENRIVQEIAEIISLDLHLEKFLEHIETISSEHFFDLENTCVYIRRAISIDDPKFIERLHMLSEWWMEVNELSKKIKKLTHTAIEMDKKVAKKLGLLFTEERRKRVKDARLRAAKSGLWILTKIALNVIPGVGIIQGLIEGAELAKMSKETLQSLRDAEAAE